MKKNKATLNDVAKVAGVSSATVSRVLNHRCLVNKETLKRVDDAMNALGYIPKGSDYAAKDEIPLIVMNVPAGNPLFYSDIIRGAFESAKAHDYYLIINQVSLSETSSSTFCNLLRRVNAAGVIMLNSVSESFLSCVRELCPVVQCCEYNDNTAFSYVSIDDYTSARNATDHLISCGCKKIAFLTDSLTYKYARRRKDGFLDSLSAAGLSVPENWIVPIADINYDMAFSACYRLLSLEDAPRAFFTVSDIFAMAAVNAAQQFHLRIPEDIMVVGFDNLEISKMMNPAITTVNQPRMQIGYSAFELLLDCILEPDATPKSVILNTELIVRNTTARSL